MKLLQINSVFGQGSTGGMAADIEREASARGHSVLSAYGRGRPPSENPSALYRIGSDLDVLLHGAASRLWDGQGLASNRATAAFLRKADAFAPDAVWLHNLHGYYINFPLLFDWIKSRETLRVFWTLHDCWPFTGHCSHFASAGCDEWKRGCARCPQKTAYPKCLVFSNSARNYELKKKFFSGVRDLTVIVPSEWMKNLAEQSFLGAYPMRVVSCRADPAAFRPTPSDFRIRHGLEGKKIILGVSAVWDDTKGLSDLIALSRLLGSDHAVVLVGVPDKLARSLPSSVTALPPVHDRRALAAAYSAADVFVNPSRQESFGMTTLEAMLCGTPAVVYKGTACEEVVSRFGFGESVPYLDVGALCRAAETMCRMPRPKMTAPVPGTLAGYAEEAGLFWEGGGA